MRYMNSMVDRIAIFATSPIRKFLLERPYCTFIPLYRPHFPDIMESWQVFPNDESICAFFQNEPLKRKEIVSLEDNEFPKVLNPMEISFSSSDVDNRRKKKEEEYKRKIGNTIFVNIGTQENTKICWKIGCCH
jgi:hypothetical protein